VTSDLTPAQAAEAVAALINSRASSPRVDELQTIIARVGQVEPTPPLHEAIRAMIRNLQSARIARCDADDAAMQEGRNADQCPVVKRAAHRVECLETEFEAMRSELWGAPVRCFGDALILAEVAQYTVGDFLPPHPSDGLIDPPGTSDAMFDALGRLTAAVLALGGRPFSIEGWGLE
jgi:hypothetical protein